MNLIRKKILSLFVLISLLTVSLYASEFNNVYNEQNDQVGENIVEIESSSILPNGGYFVAGHNLNFIINKTGLDEYRFSSPLHEGGSTPTIHGLCFGGQIGDPYDDDGIKYRIFTIQQIMTGELPNVSWSMSIQEDVLYKDINNCWNTYDPISYDILQNFDEPNHPNLDFDYLYPRAIIKSQEDSLVVVGYASTALYIHGKYPDPDYKDYYDYGEEGPANYDEPWIALWDCQYSLLHEPEWKHIFDYDLFEIYHTQVERVRAFDVKKTIDGGYIIVGWLWAGSDASAYLMKLNGVGNPEWIRVLQSQNNKGKRLYSIEQLDNGSYLAVGCIEEDGLSNSKYDVYMAYVNQNGVLTSEVIYGDSGEDDIAYDVKQYNSNWFISGFTEGITVDKHYAQVTITNHSGVVISQDRFVSFSRNFYNTFKSLLIDENDGTYITIGGGGYLSLDFDLIAKKVILPGEGDNLDNISNGGIQSGIDNQISVVELYPNTPNPFIGSTMLSFNLQTTCNVRLSIYDIQGRLVNTLVDGNLSQGSHNITWDGTDNSGNKVNSGIYLYKLITPEKSFSKIMTVIQ